MPHTTKAPAFVVHVPVEEVPVASEVRIPALKTGTELLENRGNRSIYSDVGEDEDFDDASTIVTSKSVGFDIGSRFRELDRTVRRDGTPKRHEASVARLQNWDQAPRGNHVSLTPLPRAPQALATFMGRTNLDALSCIEPYSGRVFKEVPMLRADFSPGSLPSRKHKQSRQLQGYPTVPRDTVAQWHTRGLRERSTDDSRTVSRRRKLPNCRGAAFSIETSRNFASNANKCAPTTLAERQAALPTSTVVPAWRTSLDDVYLAHDRLFYDLSHSEPVEDTLDLSNWKLADDDLAAVGKHNCAVKGLRLANCIEITDCGFALLLNFNSLTELNLRGCALLTDRTLGHIRKHMPLLEIVDISNCPLFTERGFGAFISSCRCLKSLVVRNFSHLEDVAMQAIGDSIRSRRTMTELDVAGCRRFSNESLLELLEHGGGILKRLNLSYCRQINDLGLIGLNRHGNGSMELRNLDLTGLSLRDSAMHWITAGCKLVRKLSLQGSSHVTEEGWVSLGALDHMREVDFSGCKGLTPTAFRDIFDPLSRKATDKSCIGCGSGKSLTSLNLTRCTLLNDDCLVVLGAECENLQNLVLVGVCGFTDLGLMALAKGCYRLELLNLAADTETLNLSKKSRVPQFTTVGMAALGRHCPRLRSLVLTSATRVKDAAFEAISTGCPHLESLKAQRCLGVSDKSLVALGCNCPRLLTLDLTGCKDVTNRGITTLARGCPALKKVVLVGCGNLTDESVCPLVHRCSVLESLSLMNCVLLTDNVPIEASRSNCRWSLTSLNLRGLGDVTDFGVLALKNCSNLTGLDVTFCLGVTDVALLEMARHMPFAKRSTGGRRGLEPLARGVRLFNEVLFDRQRMAAAVELFQAKCRQRQAKKHYYAFRSNRVAAIVTIQRRVRSYLVRSKITRYFEELRLSTSSAAVIQAAFRNFVSMRLAKTAINNRRRLQRAASGIQSCWTCSKYRNAAKYARRRKARLFGKWAQFIRDFQLLMKYRATLQSTIYCQRMYRKKRLEKLEQLYGCDAITIQSAWRCYSACVEYRARHTLKYRYLMDGALLIQRAYQSKKRWERTIRRVRREEKEWVLWRLAKLRVSFFINDFFRAYLWRVAAKRELARRKMHRDKAKRIQGAMRVFIARNIIRRAKTRKLQTIMRWKTIFQGILNLRLHRNAIRIQREFRKYIFRRRLDGAARKLQRAYRGFRGRSSFFDAMLNYRKDMASYIQGAWRAYMAKNIVANIHRLKHGSAARIQRCWYHHRRWLLFKAASRQVMAEKAEAHRVALAVIAANRTEEFARKLFEVGFERVVRKIQAAYREHAKARRASLTKFMEREKRFRRMKDDEDRRNAASRGGGASKTSHTSGGLLVHLGWSKTAQQKQIESKTARIRKDLDAIIEEESTASKLLRLVQGQAQTNQELREYKQAQQLSILNRQSKSVQQVGVVEMKFTVGKIEHDDFAAEMELVAKENRTIKYQNAIGFGREKPFLPIYVKLARDLTGKTKKCVHLWVMQGSGKWVWSSMTIQRAPTAHANAAANKSRIFGMREAGYIIVNHQKLDIEIQGFAPLAVGESGSALDDIVLLRNDDEWAKVEKKGYTKYEKHIGAFGLQKNWHIAYHKKEYREQPILHQVIGHYLGGHDWYNEKLNSMVESYALTIDDILNLRKNFMAIDIGKESVIDIMQVFTFHGETPGLKFGPWFMQLIESRLDDRMDFGEYICLICSVACMQKNEIHRWIFKCIDEEAIGFLEEGTFRKLCGILMDEEVTGYHTRDAAALWKHPHLGGKKDNNQDGKIVMYYPEFCKLITSFTALVYPVFRVQDKFREANLGREYWGKKLRSFTSMRGALKLPRNKATA